MKFIYLASPYSHKDESVKEHREFLITKIAARLTKIYGYAFFLPITQSAAMTRLMPNLGTSFENWEKIDKYVISKCDEVWVVKLDGWKESVGVTAEIDYAIKLNLPIYYIDPTLLNLNSTPITVL